MKYQNTWDMDRVFSGGSDSPDFYQEIDTLNKKLDKFERLVNNWQVKEDAPEFKTFEKILKNHEELIQRIGESRTFMSGLTSANVNDTAAHINLNKVSNLSKDLNNIFISLQKKMAEISDSDFDKILNKENFKVLSFPLIEIREKAQKLLSTKEEELLNNLSIDGFHAWGNMYNELVASIEVPFKEDGETKYYSAGQAENMINAEEDYDKRQEMLAIWENTWSEKANLFATTI